MKVEIKTYLWSGIVIGLISLALLLSVPSQIRLPMYDSGAPSPRIIPTVCLVGMLFCSVILLIQSLVFKKEKIYVWEWEQEKPIIVISLLLCVYVAVTIYLGFIAGVVIVFPIILFYCRERKPSVYLVTIVAGVGIYYMFRFIFNISLPQFPGFGG